MKLLLVTTDPEPASVLPALSLLAHNVRSVPPEVAVRRDSGPCDAVVIDARSDLAGSRSLCRLLGSTGLDVAVVLVVSQAGLAVLSADWGFEDILLPTAGPAEVDTRLRLLAAHYGTGPGRGQGGFVTLGELVIDEARHTVRLHGQPLDLTYKQFELLKFLARHPGQVFTRAQILKQVWGYDFLGGTRTVDVHVRHLRAKLGPGYERLIGTVRSVGYKFVLPARHMNSRNRAFENQARQTQNQAQPAQA